MKKLIIVFLSVCSMAAFGMEPDHEIKIPGAAYCVFNSGQSLVNFYDVNGKNVGTRVWNCDSNTDWGKYLDSNCGPIKVASVTAKYCLQKNEQGGITGHGLKRYYFDQQGNEIASEWENNTVSNKYDLSGAEYKNEGNLRKVEDDLDKMDIRHTRENEALRRRLEHDFFMFKLKNNSSCFSSCWISPLLLCLQLF